MSLGLGRWAMGLVDGGALQIGANEANGIALAWRGDCLRSCRRFKVKFIGSSIVLVSFGGMTLYEPKFYQCSEPSVLLMSLIGAMFDGSKIKIRSKGKIRIRSRGCGACRSVSSNPSRLQPTCLSHLAFLCGQFSYCCDPVDS